MSSSDITGKALRVCFGAVRKDASLSKVLTDICERLAFVQRDYDKAGDMDDVNYYAGMLDAYREVASWIAPIKNEKEWCRLLGLKTAEDIANITQLIADRTAA